MGFSEAIRTCFAKYVTLSGRARRSEYWYFTLFCFSANWVGNLIDKATTGVPIATFLIFLVLALPTTAVFVRRLHDIDRTGWWILLPIPVLIATIIVYVMVLLGYAAGGGVSFPVGGYLLVLVLWRRVGFSVGGLVLVLWIGMLIWMLIWLCRRGTAGPNRYGPDPVAGTIGAATSA